MTTPLLSRDPEPLWATCAECHETAEDVTIEDALRQGWAVLDDKLTCPDHLVPCTRCGDPCLLASDGCVKDGDFHCDEHAGDCGECGRYEAAQEWEPNDDL